MRNKKFSFAELAETMTVVSLEEQKLYYGGYDDKDCVWRCLAYINSNGQDYGAEAAMKLAQAYYGTSFDENNYEFKGSMAELSNFTKDFFLTIQVLQLESLYLTLMMYQDGLAMDILCMQLS